MAETKTPTKLTAQIGHSGLHRVGGIVTEEFDPDLRGIRGIRIYDQMRRNDPIVATGLAAIKWVLGQVEWFVQPGGETTQDENAAEFLESCMHDMSITWSDIIQEALTCLDFGWSWMEVVYKQRRGVKNDPASQFDDGYIGWRKLSLIGQDSLSEWDFDDNGDVQGLLQKKSSGLGTDRIPIDKSVLFRLNRERNNPEGVSLLRAVYLPWYKKTQIEEIEAIGLERDLTGVLVITLPVNATEEDYNQAVSLLEQYKADDMTGFVSPRSGPGEENTFMFQIINSPGSKSIEPDKVIQRYQMEIMRAFLAQFLMLGQGATGSWALARDQRGMFEVALGAINQSLEGVFNRFLVPPLFRLNDFGQLTSPPEIKAGRVGKADLERFSDMISTLIQAGALTPDDDLEKFIRQEMELPKLSEESDVQPEETGQGKEAAEPIEVDEDDLDEPFTIDDDEEQWVDKELDDIMRRTGSEGLFDRLRRFQRPRRVNYARQIQEARATFQRRMGDLTARFREGKIGYNDWAYQGKRLIQRNVEMGHKMGLAEAQGIYPPSRVVWTDAQRRQVEQMAREQLRYFGDFRKEVRKSLEAGEELTRRLDARSRLYGGSVRSSANEAKMTAEPERVLRWNRHADDSCPTCIEMSGNEFRAAEWHELGIWPSHGVQCDGNCQCSLESV